MPRFDVVLLDLDGTLLNTRRDLVASTNHVRATFGLPPLDAHAVERLVGHGARVLVERALGAERVRVHEEGVSRFIEHYEEHCLDHTRPYAGMAGLVDSLSAQGVRFAVITNKPERLSRKILAGLGLVDRMVAVIGGDTFPERKPHPGGVWRVLECCAADRSRALMVGDSAVDVETARAAGIVMCGVMWGFDPESLRATGLELLAADAAELGRIILEGSG